MCRDRGSVVSRMAGGTAKVGVVRGWSDLGLERD